jgi:hypothetical protein
MEVAMVRLRSRTSAAALPLVLLTVLLLPTAAAADVTTTVVSGPAAGVVHGQVATLVATVTAPVSVPTGDVQFTLDGIALGTAALSPTGTAQVHTAPLRAGSHAVRAFYLGAAGFDKSDGTATLPVARAGTATTVTLTPSTGAVAGQNIDFDVQVVPTTTPLDTPTGTIALSVFGTQLMDAPLGADGFVRGYLRLPPLTVNAVVLYSGDQAYAPSQTAVALTVNKAGTAVVLAASPAQPAVGDALTVTATVDSLAPSMWWPSGQLIRAIDGQTLSGAVTFDGSGLGTNQFAHAFTAPGLHRVTAHFTGDEAFGASDAALDVTVTGTAQSPRTTPVKPSGLSLKATPKRDRRAPYRFAISGRLQLPSGASPSDAARGKVTVDAKLKGKRVARKTTTVDSAGRFKTTITLPRKGSASITAKFAGNARVASVSARAISVRAG